MNSSITSRFFTPEDRSDPSFTASIELCRQARTAESNATRFHDKDSFVQTTYADLKAKHEELDSKERGRGSTSFGQGKVLEIGPNTRIAVVKSTTEEESGYTAYYCRWSGLYYFRHTSDRYVAVDGSYKGWKIFDM
jgi:hypothetical protein